MKKKLDELTYIGGKNIRETVFGFNSIIIIVYSIFGIGESVITGEHIVGNGNIMIGIMPFALVGLIYPTSIYNLNYYQKVKFYMISVKDVYFYHIREFYNLKNVLAFLSVAFLYDIGMSLYFGSDVFVYFIQILSGFVVSPLFVGLGFFITTIYVKGYKVLRVSLYIISYILLIPVIVFGLIATQFWIAAVVLFIIGIAGVFLLSLPMNLMDRKLEV